MESRTYEFLFGYPRNIAEKDASRTAIQANSARHRWRGRHGGKIISGVRARRCCDQRRALAGGSSVQSIRRDDEPTSAVSEFVLEKFSLPLYTMPPPVPPFQVSGMTNAETWVAVQKRE